LEKIVVFLLTLCPLAFAQPVPVSISQQLRSFSPMAQIYLNHLGLADRNNNGVIERNANEGYEQFVSKYGNADIGFHANGVTYGANNGRLEEPEIINHYYINIRFKPEFETETAAIEDEIKTFIYANNLPLVWLDDEQGTVMSAVNRVLGEGWQNQPMTLTQAENKYREVLNKLNNGRPITGRTGTPSGNNGYYTLPEMVNRRGGYCFEVAQFGFWFFSQLRINSVSAQAELTSSTLHETVKLNSGRIIDYFGSSNRYNIRANDWVIMNPLQSIGTYYRVNGNTLSNQTMLEQAVLYDKYSIGNITRLINYYFNNSANHEGVIAAGEFFLTHNNVDEILSVRRLMLSIVKDQVKGILIMLLASYSLTNNKAGYDNISTLLHEHYANDSIVKNWLNWYRL